VADPYTILGVKRDASGEEVKRAFRRLAKAHHPDKNKDDPKAQDRFSELNSAYEILGDPAKRKAFDRGEIDAQGKPRHPGFGGEGASSASARGFPGSGFPGSGFPGGGQGFRFDFGAGNPFSKSGGDPRDAFSDLFRQFETGASPGANPGAKSGSKPGPNPGANPGAGRRGAPPAGEDVMLDVAVPLEEVAKGGSVRVNLPDGRVLEVNVPQGMAHGAMMRLKGQGHPSPFGGPNGDARLSMLYARHPRFQVEGAVLRVSVSVPLADAVLGGIIRVPTLTGELEVTVPPWTSGGKILRLRAKGLPLKDRVGDLMVTLDLDLGAPDLELEALMKRKKA
jgi:DnaJ-class molecular chaperone